MSKQTPERDEWEWAVRFPGSDINHIQASEEAARALIARYADYDLTLLRRPAHIYTAWQEVTE